MVPRPFTFKPVTQVFVEKLEVERSAYIGALFHASDIELNTASSGSVTNSQFAELVNVYSDPDTKQSVASEIAAIEVDFLEVAKNLHDPRTCAHCNAKASGAGSSRSAVNGSEGLGAGGAEYAALSTNHKSNG